MPCQHRGAKMTVASQRCPICPAWGANTGRNWALISRGFFVSISVMQGGAMLLRTCLLKTVVLLLIAGLAACATGPRRQTYWVNPGVGPQVQQQRFTLDSTECMALANQMIPEPSYAPPPQPQSGTITMHTPGSGTVYGTYQSQPAPPPGYQPSGFLAGVQYSERKEKRTNYAVACLGSRGWQQRERIVGQ